MQHKLVITEKPGVAGSIAKVLGADKKKDGYLEGNGYLVSWCIGHLIELERPEGYREEWGKWTYESLPIVPEQWKYQVKDGTKKQYQLLFKLLHDERVSEVVCATDAGREGELIFRLVYEMAECSKPVKRLWISSMEVRAIKEGFENLKEGSEYDSLYDSARCRQQADWLVGINATRLFSVLNRRKTLKVGRVQTPTLAMLAEREEKIRSFRKETYYTVHLLSGGMDAVSRTFADKKAAEEAAEVCKGSQAVINSVVKEEKTVMLPLLYDLTTLQRDANRLLGFTAKQTLEYTQSLYEKKLCTYPRTDSRYLSDDMAETAGQVIEAVFKNMSFVPPVIFNPDIARILDSGKVTDHHAIIPTMELYRADLFAVPETEQKILSLIAARLLCAVCEKHTYQTVKAEFSCNGHTFSASGKTVLLEGWKVFEEAYKNAFIKQEKGKTEEKSLPELAEGMTFKNVQAKVTRHYTSPPKCFTEDSLLSAMERAGSADMEDDVERKGLGTPATRADTIEKLVKEGYVKREKRQLAVTEDGMRLVSIVPDMIKSPKLTADWENALSLVAKGELSRETFMKDIETMVAQLVHTYHDENEAKKSRTEQEPLGSCPKCGADFERGMYGPYCTGKCGMNVSHYYSTMFTDSQIRKLLSGEQILLKDVPDKDKNLRDVCLKPTGIEEYHYKKGKETVTGWQFRYEKTYPKSEKNKKCGN